LVSWDFLRIRDDFTRYSKIRWVFVLPRPTASLGLVHFFRFALIGPTGGPAEPARLAREAAHRQLVEMATSF
jgi:hypothetical protein